MSTDEIEFDPADTDPQAVNWMATSLTRPALLAALRNALMAEDAEGFRRSLFRQIGAEHARTQEFEGRVDRLLSIAKDPVDETWRPVVRELLERMDATARAARPALRPINRGRAELPEARPAGRGEECVL